MPDINHSALFFDKKTHLQVRNNALNITIKTQPQIKSFNSGILYTISKWCDRGMLRDLFLKKIKKQIIIRRVIFHNRYGAVHIWKSVYYWGDWGCHWYHRTGTKIVQTVWGRSKNSVHAMATYHASFIKKIEIFPWERKFQGRLKNLRSHGKTTEKRKNDACYFPLLDLNFENKKSPINCFLTLHEFETETDHPTYPETYLIIPAHVWSDFQLQSAKKKSFQTINKSMNAFWFH